MTASMPADRDTRSGPRVRVSTGEVERPDSELRPGGDCRVYVDEEPVDMEVLVDTSAADPRSAGEDWPVLARGVWRGYEIQVQVTGVALDGLRLTRAGDLGQYRRHSPPAS